MLARLVHFLLLLSVIALGFASALAQRGADNKPVFTKPCYGEEDVAKFAKETCEKMRIDQAKKDHDEMLKRGEEVRRLSERLVKAFELKGSLSDEDRNLLESLEKNVKKIRDQLGGDGDDEKIDDILGPDKTPTFANAVDKLKTAASDLVDELNKTTRFNISATAIQSSNTVLTVARFLRIWK